MNVLIISSLLAAETGLFDELLDTPAAPYAPYSMVEEVVEGAVEGPVALELSIESTFSATPRSLSDFNLLPAPSLTFTIEGNLLYTLPISISLAPPKDEGFPLASFPSSEELKSIAYRLEGEDYPDSTPWWMEDTLRACIYLQNKYYADAFFQHYSFPSANDASNNTLAIFLSSSLKELELPADYATRFSLGKPPEISLIVAEDLLENVTPSWNPRSLPIPGTKTEVSFLSLSPPSTITYKIVRKKEKVDIGALTPYKVVAYTPDTAIQCPLPFALCKLHSCQRTLPSSPSLINSPHHYPSPFCLERVPTHLSPSLVLRSLPNPEQIVKSTTRLYQLRHVANTFALPSAVHSLALPSIDSLFSQEFVLSRESPFALAALPRNIPLHHLATSNFSFPQFHRRICRREVTIDKWSLPRYQPKVFHLTTQEGFFAKSKFSFFALHSLPAYKTHPEYLTTLLAKKFQPAPDPLLIPATTSLSRFHTSSSLAYSAFPRPYHYPILHQTHIVNSAPAAVKWTRAHPEAVKGNFSFAVVVFNPTNLDPPESGRRALLYPISNRDYGHLILHELVTTPLTKTGLIQPFTPHNLGNADVSSRSYAPSFFTHAYDTSKAARVSVEEPKWINAHYIASLAIPHTYQPIFADMGKFLPFTTDYMLGVELLQIRDLASQTTVIEDARWKNRTYRCTAYGLATIPTLQELKTESASDEFVISTGLVPQMMDEGYIFSINLSLRELLGRPSLRHHVYFLIDRCSSIERHRFDVFKNAVASAAAVLDEDQFFNIFMFDNKVEVLSPSDLRPTSTSIKIAKDFLDKQDQPWLSSNNVLFDLLDLIHEQANKSEDLYSVIVLTNGSGLKGIEYHKQNLRRLQNTPHDNFFIYTAAMGDKNHLAMLDLLSGLYGGSLLYSHTHAAFPRKLAILTKQIKYPVLTDLRISLLGQPEGVELHQSPKLTPCLCKEGHTHFLGTSKQLKEFDVLIQGRAGERFVNIRKRINLPFAIRGRAGLEKQLALQKAYSHFSRFLITDDSSELTAAEALLKPFNITPP